MELWSWICELPSSDEWADSSSSELTFHLATAPNTTKSILLKARQKLGPNSEVLAITFYVCYEEKPIWVSDTCPLSSDKPLFLPLVLQLLQEIISHSPAAATCPGSQLKLSPDPVSWVMDSHSPESFSGFFNLVFLTRLFWLCVCDAPSEVGSLYFNSLLASNLETFACNHAPVLRAFFVAAGVDVEVCFMRMFGYMLAKWLILKEVASVGLQMLTTTSPSQNLGFSYATERNGLWVLKGYSPVTAMKRLRFYDRNLQYPMFDTKESVLKYALAHQQFEAVVQLEYTVSFNDNFIQVSVHVDNIRLHVTKLGFNNNKSVEEDIFMNERHFPSRVRVWVGPEAGASYVTSLSLGRSTENVEKEVENQKILKGSFGKLKVPRVKAMTRTTTKAKVKNWRSDQDSEGHMAIFDSTLCDHATGVEIATWQPHNGNIKGDNGNVKGDKGNNLDRDAIQSFQKRYAGANRSFTKSGSLVFTGDGGWGEGVKWRLNKEMEGSMLKWRIGGRFWLSYLPNEVKSSYIETRCVEWCDEIDLPLINSRFHGEH